MSDNGRRKALELVAMALDSADELYDVTERETCANLVALLLDSSRKLGDSKEDLLYVVNRVWDEGESDHATPR